MMDLSYLWEFTVVAEKRNFSLAAEDLFTSQSTLSKHIANMEKELNTKLFHRNTRNISLTKAGELLLPMAKEICASYSTFQQQLYLEERAKKASVSILSIPTLAQYNIINTIYDFQTLYPGIEIKITEQESLNITTSLEHSEHEFAITRFFGEIPEQYDYIELCRDDFVAILPSNHLLADRDTVPLRMLRDETFILLGKDTKIDLACQDLFQSAGFSPKVKYQGRRPENIVGFVSMGMGVSLLMRKHAEFFHTPRITIREVSPTTKSRICLIWKKNYILSPSATTFMRFLRKSAQHND